MYVQVITGFFKLIQITTGYYVLLQNKQFSARYSLNIYRGCSFKQYIVLILWQLGSLLYWLFICLFSSIKLRSGWLYIKLVVCLYAPANILLLLLLYKEINILFQTMALTHLSIKKKEAPLCGASF